MDSGILNKDYNEIEENINPKELENQTETDIDAQIDILASVLIEILLKDIS